MKRQCIVCKKIMGEVGDKTNGDVTGAICEQCLLEVEEYRFYKRMHVITGFQLFKNLMDNALKQLEMKGGLL